MKYISIRGLVTEKKLGDFSHGVRPLTYATVLRRVIDHVDAGNKMGFIIIGDGRCVRYAIREDQVDKFIGVLKEYYARD